VGATTVRAVHGNDLGSAESAFLHDNDRRNPAGLEHLGVEVRAESNRVGQADVWEPLQAPGLLLREAWARCSGAPQRAPPVAVRATCVRWRGRPPRWYRPAATVGVPRRAGSMPRVRCLEGCPACNACQPRARRRARARSESLAPTTRRRLGERALASSSFRRQTELHGATRGASRAPGARVTLRLALAAGRRQPRNGETAASAHPLRAVALKDPA